MRWDRDHESPDLIDRRGARGGGGLGGLLGLAPFLLRSRVGRIVLLLLVLGGLRNALRGGEPRAIGETRTTEDAEKVHFVSFVLDDTQDAWRSVFASRGQTYRNAKLVLFTDATRTACGAGDAQTGPFYCPTDERVYLDLGFFQELSRRLGARGEFAQAYVIAHEIGHHVQNQLGTSERVHDAPRAAVQGATGLSVRLELQADCFAGIWARSTQRRDLLEQGDIESAMNAAAAIGDDRLQRQATGTVSPERWTHGSSAARMRWFQRGYDTGSMEGCDTFSAPSL